MAIDLDKVRKRSDLCRELALALATDERALMTVRRLSRADEALRNAVAAYRAAALQLIEANGEAAAALKQAAKFTQAEEAVRVFDAQHGTRRVRPGRKS